MFRQLSSRYNGKDGVDQLNKCMIAIKKAYYGYI
jgi:hypothetical protein